jgi:uncharacterized protein (TIGR02246 family)
MDLPMKLPTVLLGLLLAAVAVAFSRPAVAALDAGDEQTLLALAAHSDELWNQRDAEALSALFAADADLAIGDRTRVASRDAIRTYFTESFSQMTPDLRHVMQVRAMRETTPGVVLADGDVRIERLHADGSREVLRRFTTTSLVVRDGDGWRFMAVRAVPVALAPAANGQ